MALNMMSVNMKTCFKKMQIAIFEQVMLIYIPWWTGVCEGCVCFWEVRISHHEFLSASLSWCVSCIFCLYLLSYREVIFFLGGLFQSYSVFWSR